jgi:hypothetical protein
MRTTSVVLMLVLFVTTVAVGGSRAEPIPGASVAFQQCQGPQAEQPASCRPGGPILISEDFGMDRDTVQAADYGWDSGWDYGESQAEQLASPEFWRELVTAAVRAGVVAFAAEFAARLADQYFGNQMFVVAEARGEPTLFDPRQ